MDDAQLDDGRYDAFVVWAEARDDGQIAFDLTITTGAHKGEVLTVLARSTRDPIALVGLPCTLFVEDGQSAASIRRLNAASPPTLRSAALMVAPSRFELPLPP